MYVAMSAPSRFYLQRSGEAVITLERFSNPDQALSVKFSTNPPINPVNVLGKQPVVAATAGEQYLPVDQVVTFPPGETKATVSVPIVGEAENPGIALVGLTVTPLAANATVSTADIAIASGPDRLPLAINDARMIRDASGASAVTMTFNQPMARATVENLGVYRVARGAIRLVRPASDRRRTTTPRPRSPWSRRRRSVPRGCTRSSSEPTRSRPVAASPLPVAASCSPPSRATPCPTPNRYRASRRRPPSS
ncbi:MAG: hypothetical protein U0794_04025 [Isosphaeraceae bacterium]